MMGQGRTVGHCALAKRFFCRSGPRWMEEGKLLSPATRNRQRKESEAGCSKLCCPESMSLVLWRSIKHFLQDARAKGRHRVPLGSPLGASRSGQGEELAKQPLARTCRSLPSPALPAGRDGLKRSHGKNKRVLAEPQSSQPQGISECFVDSLSQR